MRLEELMPGQRVRGLTAEPVEIVSTSWSGGNYLLVTYRDMTGVTGERLLDREDESGISGDLTEEERAFGGDPQSWKQGAEALRIRHAALIDPMLAVSNSSLQPLPHQITAVYGELLPRTPLRFLLADDPGAGKTIMCGLYVKELLLRGDLDRCLIVAPGGLVEQWQDELWQKFGLQFRILSRELMTATVGVSVFDDNPLLIARMDMLARNEKLQALLEQSEWDLVVVDEAHRMSARWTGRELEATKRYALGKVLGRLTRNLLLMTATPHSGDPSAFQAFLALLDEDRFAGSAKASVAPGTDLMRRMLKEELLTMDGTPLFPERRASTVSYRLTPLEQELYDAVSDYVRHEMNRAERLKRQGDGKAAYTVGFALTVLQRRLASSPEAILRSLQRRHARLTRLREDFATMGELRTPELAGVAVTIAGEQDWLEQDSTKVEEDEEALVDAASAARTVAELDTELLALDDLVTLATQVRGAQTDRKWAELRSILEEDRFTRDESGAPRKIIIFTEHRDTLWYLAERIRALPGRTDAVVEIHGGVSRPARRGVQERFLRDPGTSVLVATDAAGEGLNLQCAHLMVNYDLPWNPNRIEQRFGRIHRIGQTEVCHLWNLVAEDTREGDVFLRLLGKMEEQSKAYQGKVFDVLGEAFEGAPLRDLLVRAVRYGDDPAVRQQLHTVIDDRVGSGIPELVERRALYQEVLQQVDVAQARERVDLGVRSRLQPHFASTWFESTFKALGGRTRRRADGLHDVTHVPDDIRALARSGSGQIVRQRYEAVTFDPDRPPDANGALPEVLGPGHALLDAVAELAESRFREHLRDGVVLVDTHGSGTAPRLFCAVSHEVTDGHTTPHALSRRVAFVELADDGSFADVGPAYLDYRPAEEGEADAVRRVLAESPYREGGVTVARDWALRHLVPDHVAQIRQSHAIAVDRSRTEITERMQAEIAHWQARAGRGSRVGRESESPEVSSRRALALESRLARRLAELDADGKVVARPPHVLACAVVIPSSLLDGKNSSDTTPQAALRAAAGAVEAAERLLGNKVLADPDAGFETVRTSPADGLSRWVDVRLPPAAGRSIRLTRTQVLHARNLKNRYRLALVQQEPGRPGEAEVRYAVDPFARVRLDDFHQHEFELPWSLLWRSAEAPK